MNLANALTDVERLYMDTAPLVYYIEASLAYAEKMDTIIQRIEGDPILAVSSVILLPEVLTHPLRLGRQDLEKAYREILLTNKNFQLLEVSLPIAEKATTLRANHNLRTPDAIHVATALEAGCQAFLTNDLGLKRVSEIRVLVLDELELDETPDEE